MKYNLTVEALCDPDGVDQIDQQGMYQELVDIGIIAKDANIISQHKQVIHNTFPVLWLVTIFFEKGRPVFIFGFSL